MKPPVRNSGESVSASIPLPVRLLLETEDAKALYPRDRNKIKIFHAICTSPGVTRKDLVTELSMRPGTVSELVQELVTDGLVNETIRSNRSERGRPEIPLTPNCSRWTAISVFCVSMELHAVLVDGADRTLESASCRIPASASNIEIESLLVELIRKVLESSLDTGELLGVSLCVPGIVDSDAREWVFSARWPRLRRLSLHDAERALGVRIHVRRQLDVLLEYAMLKEPALRTGGTLLFHWGYGIGAAFSMNGKVIGSSKGVFCQIGHVSIHPRSTKPCLCGRIGCLEADAALWALTPEIERTEGAVPESELDFVKMFNERPIASTEYFRNALFSVIHAVSHLQAILIPDRVIMYGPFLANEQVFRTLTTEVKQLSPPFVTENTSFELMDDSLGWHAAAGTISIFHQAYRVTLLRRGAQTAGQPISAALREFL